MVAQSPASTSPEQQLENELACRVAMNIAQRRHALGLTQAQLAERLGVDTETLSRFERGKHLPKLANLARLAYLLQTTVAALLAEEAPKVDEDAVVLSAWLAPLSDADRLFVRGVVKQCCDHLVSQKSGDTASE